MSRRPAVSLRLTLAEARALSHAAGNSTSAPDAMVSLFPHGASRDAAYRAHDALREAIREALARPARRREQARRLEETVARLDADRVAAGRCRHCGGRVPCPMPFGDAEVGKRHDEVGS